MAPEEFFSQYLRVSEWWIFSSILHLLPLIICADPDPQRSWIRIQFGVFTTILQLSLIFCYISCPVGPSEQIGWAAGRRDGYWAGAVRLLQGGHQQGRQEEAQVENAYLPLQGCGYARKFVVFLI